MTNETPPPVETSPPLRVDAPRESTGTILFLIACAMGVLRAVAIILEGGGEPARWCDAAYAALLHVGVGFLFRAVYREMFGVSGRAQPVREEAPVAAIAAGEAVATPASPPAVDPATWRARLDAAREAGDAARVLELREEAPDGLEPSTLKELDAALAGWFLGLVHRRLRSGPLQLDLVTLVDRIAETMGHTKEGASLRAALPTLRRGAGLCPRCAGPYTGVWEACPECMGRPEPPPPVIPGLVAAELEDLEVEVSTVEERWFVDPDEERGGEEIRRGGEARLDRPAAE